MAIETKEEVLKRILSGERPKCPHCGMEMSIWAVPQVTFADGLGWGVPYLFVCFNNHCPLYEKGWEQIKAHYGHHASYRCILYPETSQFETMLVFSPSGGTGQIIDEELVARQKALKAAIKRELSILADCKKSKNWKLVLKILFSSDKSNVVRTKAAEIIGDIGELEAIDPIRNHTFKDDSLLSMVEKSVEKIHERYYTRECPFCAETIKKKAKICKHCGKTLPPD